MTKEKDKRLVEAFPNLYRNRHGDIQTSAMPWGFECDDGWFNLIWNISEKLEALIIQYKKDYPDDELPPCASQVKEKYGSLRFYMTGYTDEIDRIIDDAEHRSALTCEICGKEGRIRGERWYKCVCDEHAEA